MTNSKYVTLALIEGELSTITVEAADDGEDLLLFAPNAATVARALTALRRAYPTNLIRVAGQAGNFVDVVQTGQHLAALQATYQPAG
jgi:hypothetical protein